MKTKFVFFLILFYTTIPFLYFVLTRNQRELIITNLKEPYFKNSKTIKITTYNIARGRDGILRNDKSALNDPKKITAQLIQIGNSLKSENVNIVVLNEVDFNCSRTFRIDMAEVIAKAGDFSTIIRQPNVDSGWGIERYLFGNAILTNLPASEMEKIHLPKRHPLMNFFVGKMDGLSVKVKSSSDLQIQIIGLHLEVISIEKRLEAVDKILSKIRKDIPVVLMGDLNSTLDNPNDAVNTLIKKANFNLPPKNDFTFPSWKPDKRIDYILMNQGKYIDYKIPLWKMSDHLPVISTLEF